MRIRSHGIERMSFSIWLEQYESVMDSRTHVYYITVSDVQDVAKETLGRHLNDEELNRVTRKLLDRIQWYEPLEQLILAEDK